MSSSLARSLRDLSAIEMTSALGLSSTSTLGVPVTLAFRGLSTRLGEVLAGFDDDTSRMGLSAAAERMLSRLGVTLRVEGSCPGSGGLLVVCNHPGAYDALAMMAAIGRDDLAIAAADRSFLRALPSVSRHLVFLPETTGGRANAARAAIEHVRGGGALLHFGAGEIEPDPAFTTPRDEAVLRPWTRGTGVLARSATRVGAAVVPAIVSGVHSPRAKRLFLTRWAEARGVTTLAPLLAVALPGFRDVDVRVAFGKPAGQWEHASSWSDTTAAAAEIRALALALCR